MTFQKFIFLNPFFTEKILFSQKFYFVLAKNFFMKEISFINSNAERWQNFENIIDNPLSLEKPDVIADLFIQITDDLSYSRAYFPQSRITQYLNSLASRTHQIIYRNKKEKTNQIVKFWLYDFPKIIFEKKKYIAFALIVFLVSIGIGILSAAYDDTFVRLILGNRYLEMTLENIEDNDPMAVYKKVNQTEMFLGISINNIFVSFYAFIFGIFLSIGTIYILFSNGIMIGSFLYLFYQHNLLKICILTIFIHGTLELFAITVAGAAGMLMGNSILFPETFSRTTSFKFAAQNGIKMTFGLIPIFIVAGFLEGFVTRYTEMPNIFKAFIILSSFAFIIWYFVIYPEKLFSQNKS